jgi:hypothetical protein
MECEHRAVPHHAARRAATAEPLHAPATPRCDTACHVRRRPQRMLCYAMLCYAMLCYAVLWYAMLRYATLCCAMPCYAMLAMLCYAMLCYAMLCYAMLCYAMLCYAMLRPQRRDPGRCVQLDRQPARHLTRTTPCRIDASRTNGCRLQARHRVGGRHGARVQHNDGRVPGAPYKEGGREDAMSI